MTDKFIINRMACDNCKKIRKQTAEEIIKMLENEFFQGNEIITLSPADIILKNIRKKYLEGQ